jgi:hypothetical protein
MDPISQEFREYWRVKAVNVTIYLCVLCSVRGMKYETEDRRERTVAIFSGNYHLHSPLLRSHFLKLYVLCKLHLSERRIGTQLQAPETKLSSRPITRKNSSLSQYSHKPFLF